MPAPEQKGIRGRIIATLTQSAWNRLPLDCRDEEDMRKVKANIKLCA